MYETKTGRLLDRRELLKIKLKSLAAEIQFIRKEERKTWGLLHNEMRRHRLELREEVIKTLLAYQIVRGKMTAEEASAEVLRLARNAKILGCGPFNQAECLSGWNKAVDAMVTKYGPPKQLTLETTSRPRRLDRAAQDERAARSYQRRALRNEKAAESEPAAPAPDPRSFYLHLSPPNV